MVFPDDKDELCTIRGAFQDSSQPIGIECAKTYINRETKRDCGGLDGREGSNAIVWLPIILLLNRWVWREYRVWLSEHPRNDGRQRQSAIEALTGKLPKTAIRFFTMPNKNNGLNRWIGESYRRGEKKNDY